MINILNIIFLFLLLIILVTLSYKRSENREYLEKYIKKVVVLFIFSGIYTYIFLCNDSKYNLEKGLIFFLIISNIWDKLEKNENFKIRILKLTYILIIIFKPLWQVFFI